MVVFCLIGSLPCIIAGAIPFIWKLDAGRTVLCNFMVYVTTYKLYFNLSLHN